MFVKCCTHMTCHCAGDRTDPLPFKSLLMLHRKPHPNPPQKPPPPASLHRCSLVPVSLWASHSTLSQIGLELPCGTPVCPEGGLSRTLVIDSPPRPLASLHHSFLCPGMRGMHAFVLSSRLPRTPCMFIHSSIHAQTPMAMINSSTHPSVDPSIIQLFTHPPITLPSIHP